MEIKILQEINEKEVARVTAYKLVEDETMSLREAIEDAIYEVEGVCMTVTEEAILQLKSIIIDKLTTTITYINNECAN